MASNVGLVARSVSLLNECVSLQVEIFPHVELSDRIIGLVVLRHIIDVLHELSSKFLSRRSCSEGSENESFHT